MINYPSAKNSQYKVNDSKGNSTQALHPTFCLRNIKGTYGLEHCEKNEKVQFLNRLHKLSTMTWQDIMQADRHGLGCEQIKATSIKASIPIEYKNESYFLAFRFDGSKPFVGVRNNELLIIIWIDRNLTLYNHGH